MRSLALSSLLLFAAGCGRLLYQDLAPAAGSPAALKALKPAFATTLYRADIDVVGKHLSGLLFFKNLPDGSYRVVFTNEMGLNLFDFHFADGKFEVLHVIEQLNNRSVITQLRKDIGFFLMADLDYSRCKVYRRSNQRYYSFATRKEITTYVTDSATKVVSSIENATPTKLKVVVGLTKLVAGMPDSVFVEHKLFPFTISLKQIQR